MWIVAVSDFTTTNWAWNTIWEWWLKLKKSFLVTQEMKDEVWGITSYHDFIGKYKTVKWELHKKYINWKKFLNNIEKELKLKYHWKSDPVEYLLYLYSIKTEWLSVADIEIRVGHLWYWKHDETFRRFFVDILWWALRESNDRTEHNLKKARATKNTNWFIGLNDTRQDDAIENFKIAFQNILDLKENELDFITEDIIIDNNEMNKLRFKRDKILYLLSKIFNLKIIVVIQKIILINEGWVWHGAIAKWFQKIIDDIWYGQYFKISKSDIRHIINKNESII